MKIAFSTLSCPNWSLEQIITTAQQLGYHGLELRVLDNTVLELERDRAKIGEAVKQIRDAGLEVCAIDTSCTLNQPTEEERQAQVEGMRAWIGLAGELHIPLLRVFGGQNKVGSATDLSEEEVNILIAEELKAVAAEAEQAGVTIALETHDAFSSAYRVARVLNKVQSPNIAALWDSMHTYRVGEASEEVIRELGSRIAHYHVKDAVRTTDNGWDLSLLGDGEVPVADQLTQLKLLGYEGWISVEWEKMWHPEIAEPEVALPEHISWLSTFLPTLESIRLEQ